MLVPLKYQITSYINYHEILNQITKKMPDFRQKSSISKIQYKLYLNKNAKTKDQQPGILAGFKTKIQNY